MDDQTAVGKPIDILLVEDDAGEVLLTREAFLDFKLGNRLVVLGDGREAWHYLHENATLPGLILLDLNLPGIDGRDLLEYIADDPTLRHIPVVVLTSSIAERDILRARRLRVADYIIKPVDFQRIVEVVRHIEQLGFSVVRTSV
jgi:CheY-like chemotaxis protein